MIRHRFARLASGGTAALLVAVAAGCSSAPPPKTPAVYFPPAPAPPRIQYLTSFSGSTDIEKQSNFDRFVVGQKVNLRLDKPYGVALDGGKLYVCDTNATLVVFDLDKKKFYPLEAAIQGPGRLIQPINISIGSDRTRYVSDPVRGQVVAYDANDRYVRAYGASGGWRPVDAVAFEGRLYVADSANALVHVFDLASGELLKAIGAGGEPAERLAGPTNLAFDAEGYLYVSDFKRFQIVKYDRDGHFRATIGKPGDNFGHFARPKGIAIDRQGILYAVDAAFNNVQMFNREGRLLMYFGGPGQAPGNLYVAAKVAIDYDDVKYFQSFAAPGFEIEYLVLVTNQLGPNAVSVFGYGRDRTQKYPTEEEIRKAIEERRQRELEQQPAEPASEEPPPEPPPAEPPPAAQS